ncbi:hypothetical protein [Novosphingobium sp. AP12]|uniref:hypothetical protein n=1 Tax=Novosphingobium sp. AP12 TaxID=1144305 RepID=UPI0002720614|nr:hypothetical protein [Novosphingobium sp. AP12]EJL21185.1 hypothetical protein PMI02_05256 [Novosphingobium sp. AP12]
MNRTILLLSALAAFGAAQTGLAQDAQVTAGTPAAAKAMADPDVITVRNVTRTELVPGLPILEDGGATIGTVARLAGNDVILVSGEGKRAAEYRLPITQLFAYTQDGVDRFASRTPRSALKAEGSAAVAVNGNR